MGFLNGTLLPLLSPGLRPVGQSLTLFHWYPYPLTTIANEIANDHRKTFYRMHHHLEVRACANPWSVMVSLIFLILQYNWYLPYKLAATVLGHSRQGHGYARIEYLTIKSTCL